MKKYILSLLLTMAFALFTYSQTATGSTKPQTTTVKKTVKTKKGWGYTLQQYIKKEELKAKAKTKKKK